MDKKQYKKRIDDEVINPLVDIRNEDDDCGFCTRKVMMLRKMLFKYLAKLAKDKKPVDEKLLKQMKKLVYSINKLNRQSDYCMLESEIGDDLTYIIEDIAFDAGLTKTDGDITKPWREEW